MILHVLSDENHSYNLATCRAESYRSVSIASCLSFSLLNTMREQELSDEEKDTEILCNKYESIIIAGDEQGKTKNNTGDFKIVEAKTCQ